MDKNAISLSVLLTAFSACAPCDYERLSKLPLESSVPGQYRDNVTFVKDVRKFAIEQLGLDKCTPHYTTFSATDKKAKIFYRLFVTKPTVLPNAWEEASIFFENNTAYRDDVTAMYFSSYVDTLEDELQYYTEEGYDVYVRNTTNYSLVKSKDGSSLTPSFFKYSQEWQANTIIHEMCHGSYEKWIGSNFSSRLNESSCVLIGYAGAAEYYKSRNGGSSKEYESALKAFNDYENESLKLNQFYAKLQELYQSHKTSSEIQQEREKIFAEVKEIVGEEVNNANLWDRYPYVKNYPLMLQLYKSQHNSIPQVLLKMKDCPENEEKALKYIQGLVK